jgi:hypothetical protein
MAVSTSNECLVPVLLVAQGFRLVQECSFRFRRSGSMNTQIDDRRCRDVLAFSHALSPFELARAMSRQQWTILGESS